MSTELDIKISEALNLKIYFVMKMNCDEKKYLIKYSSDLQDTKIVIDKMGKRGFWLKLTSPFVPTEECRPKNPDFWGEWERTRNFWVASFDFHGTVDTRPLWRGESENPAEAIVLAALQCIEGNLEIF